MTPNATDQVEIWKKIVDVQQHFNDLELRIRNFALVLTGAVLGLGGYAIKDGGMVYFLGREISVASVIVGFSLVPLMAFYLMDRFWYHRLLDGSVKAGAEVEGRLRDMGLKVDLGGQISRASPFNFLWIKGLRTHSKHKMDGFYLLIGISIVGLAIALAKAQPLQSGTQTTAAPTGCDHATIKLGTHQNLPSTKPSDCKT